MDRPTAEVWFLIDLLRLGTKVAELLEAWRSRQLLRRHLQRTNTRGARQDVEDMDVKITELSDTIQVPSLLTYMCVCVCVCVCICVLYYCTTLFSHSKIMIYLFRTMRRSSMKTADLTYWLHRLSMVPRPRLYFVV